MSASLTIYPHQASMDSRSSTAFRSGWVRSHWLFILLLTASITRLWLMPLPSSFWTDETGTFFVVTKDPSLLSVPQLPYSIYYRLPSLSAHIFGSSEVSYRLPSVILMAIALFFIGRLAERLIEPGAGWFAVFACLAMHSFNFYAADARPYALGICISTVSLWFLIDWLDTARWRSALLFLLFAALLWRVQLVFWAFYPVYPIYALSRRLSGTTKVSMIRLFGAGAVLLVALLPVAFEALSYVHHSGRFYVAPGAADTEAWIRTFSWKAVAICAVSVWAAALFLKRPRRNALSTHALVLIAAWWIWMPLCLFLYSRLSNSFVFVPRYFSPALPGVVLASTAAAGYWLPRAYWKQASVLLAVGGLVLGGQWNVRWPSHGWDNWRQATSLVNGNVQNADTPVLIVSPFVEAQSPFWRPDYPLPAFPYAPFTVYPVRGRVYPFAYWFSQEGQQYAARLLRDSLTKQGRFILYGPGSNIRRWVDWFSQRTELAGWRNTTTDLDAEAVVVFQKPGARSASSRP